MAGEFGAHYRLIFVADEVEVLTAQGLRIAAQTQWPALGPDDLVIVPGWEMADPGSNALAGVLFSRALLDRVREHHVRGGTVASVCAGAAALGRVGLLDGRRCTTHHELQDDLARLHPRAVVVRDVLYVTDDRVGTSAGIASGIDLALHLVEERHGPAVAARVARTMVVPARRNGGEPQASAMLRHRDHLIDLVHRAQEVLDAQFAEPLPLERLAAGLGVSERTLTRAFVRAIGLTPLRYQQILRLERAEWLISHGQTVESAARAVGFQDARMLRRLRASASRPGPGRSAQFAGDRPRCIT